jgi:uncharacterized integral membrane protein (TIGR00698 family)
VLPGLGVAVAIAVAATGIGRLLPVLGAPVAGIVLGVVLSGFAHRRAVLQPGIRLAAGFVLQLAVVVLGSQLSLGQVAAVGTSSLPVMLGTLAACLTAAWALGRWLGIDRDLRTLIGVGTGICGASAIAAVSPVIKARNATVAYAMATIFFFNVAAVLLFPPLGHLLHLGQDAFGLFAGTAVNDTSSVVAATTVYGSAAASYGVVVKLSRSLMIIPVCVGLGVRPGSRRGVGRLPWRRMCPPFLLGFLAASALDTLGVIPSGWHTGLATASTLLVTVALAGIGLGTRPGALRAAGPRPLVLGAALWVGVGVTSLLLQAATGVS